jgi:hypothetical protein
VIPNPSQTHEVFLSSEELRKICAADAALLPTPGDWQKYFRAVNGEAWWDEFKRVHPKSVAIVEDQPRRKLIVKVEGL